MTIDITKPPLSTQAIEALKGSLSSQISMLEFKRRLLIRLAVVLATLLFVFAIAGNAFYDWMPWVAFVVFAVAVAVAFPSAVDVGFGFAVVAGVAATFSAAATFGVTAACFVVIVIAIAIAAAFPGANYLCNLNSRLDDQNRQISALEDSSKEACLSIVDWLSDPAIASYLAAVQREGRMFTKGEVDAMREHFTSREERNKKSEHEDAVKDACRKVYAGALIPGDQAS